MPGYPTMHAMRPVFDDEITAVAYAVNREIIVIPDVCECGRPLGQHVRGIGNGTNARQDNVTAQLTYLATHSSIVGC